MHDLYLLPMVSTHPPYDEAFVERAELFDPRVLKKKQEEKDAREARRTAKGSGKKEAEEAAKLEAETAAAAAAAAAEADKAGKVGMRCSARVEVYGRQPNLRHRPTRMDNAPSSQRVAV